jgi:hypothetical protein
VSHALDEREKGGTPGAAEVGMADAGGDGAEAAVDGADAAVDAPRPAVDAPEPAVGAG